MQQSPLVGLLSDFGLSDGYVGVMKAVLLSIAPAALLVDISHDIAPQDIEMGAWTLGMAWRYFPAGSVFLCVVDPGVGSARRAIALVAHGRYFVGPDNGLFSDPLVGSPPDEAQARCVCLDDARYHLPTTSATFHGRDIFAPCAARLATGTPLAALGTAVDPASLVRLPIARTPTQQGDSIVGRVAHVDHFGNLISNIGPTLTRLALASPQAQVQVAGHVVSARATHFAAGAAGEPYFIQDSSGALAIVVRNASAARALGVGRGAVVTVRGLVGARVDDDDDDAPGAGE